MASKPSLAKGARRAAAPAPAPAPSPAPAIDRYEMGRRLRVIRKGRKLTLTQVSELSGVTVPTLSKMELGQVSISYEKFAAVARALEVDISRLFEDRPAGAVTKRPTFTRIALRSTTSFANEQYVHQVLATEYPDKRMTPWFTRIQARSMDDYAGFNHHPGHEFLMVISGRIKIVFENGETLELSKDEGAYFDSGTGHVYLSIGRKDAECLMVMTA